MQHIPDNYAFERIDVCGVPIYYKRFDHAPCIHIRWGFKTGAYCDPVGKEGVAHFVEHLVFTGSPTLQDKKAIKEWSKKFTLNSWNAATNLEYTNYTARCLPVHFDEVMRKTKEMIFDAYFREEDIEQERGVILQEAWGRFVNEKLLAYIRDMMENNFPRHIRNRFYTALGWPKTIEQISPDDIRTWHKNHYGRENFFIVLTGAIEPEHIDALTQYISGIPSVQPHAYESGEIASPIHTKVQKTADEIGQVKEKTEIGFFRVFMKMSIEDRYTMQLLARMLQDILHERLRIERGLCYGVSVSPSHSGEYSSCSTDVRTDEKNIEIVQQELYRALKEIQEGEHQDRYTLIKSMRIEQVLSSEELTDDIADTVTSEIHRFGNPISIHEVLRQLERTTYEDVAHMAEYIFDPAQTVFEVILPSQKS